MLGHKVLDTERQATLQCTSYVLGWPEVELTRVLLASAVALPLVFSVYVCSDDVCMLCDYIFFHQFK